MINEIKTKSDKECLIKNADMILQAINKGYDVELRQAAGGGLKILIVTKQLLRNNSLYP